MKNLTDPLKQLKNQHLYRQRKILNGQQHPHTPINGQKILNFCANDYLGLAAHPKVIEALQKGAQKYGAGAGSAHLVNGHQSAHHELEEALAVFCKRPRALLFSTGYMANMGVISALLNHQDMIFQDRLNHASLIDGARLSRAKLQRYPHQDMENLKQRLAKAPKGPKIVATDGVFSMDGDIANLKQLTLLCQQYQAWLMVDDAHGFGVLGEYGRGCTANYNIEQVPILMGTLGKAFGTFGAFIAGSEDLIETLIQKARCYIYTTAMPGAMAHATLTSLAIAQEETWRREHLQSLIQIFKTEAMALGLPLMPSNTPIQPIMAGSSEQALKWSEQLMNQGILVTAIRPPTVPKNAARLRITFSANHSETDLAQLLSALSQLN